MRELSSHTNSSKLTIEGSHNTGIAPLVPTRQYKKLGLPQSVIQSK